MSAAVDIALRAAAVRVTSASRRATASTSAALRPPALSSIRLRLIASGLYGRNRWARIVMGVSPPRPSLVEFPADEPDRARHFWGQLLEAELPERRKGEGEGWQTRGEGPAVGVHERGRGPGDSFSLPYFTVGDLPEALSRVEELGGTIVHPGDQFAICTDSEGNPFGLSAEPAL
jgi:predicted enzyme related to lactoylglutathione lyase